MKFLGCTEDQLCVKALTVQNVILVMLILRRNGKDPVGRNYLFSLLDTLTKEAKIAISKLIIKDLGVC